MVRTPRHWLLIFAYFNEEPHLCMHAQVLRQKSGTWVSLLVDMKQGWGNEKKVWGYRWEVEGRGRLRNPPGRWLMVLCSMEHGDGRQWTCNYVRDTPSDHHRR